MSLHKVKTILIGDGTAIPAGASAVNTTNVATGDIAVVGKNALTLTAGNTVSDSDGIYIFQGQADGNLKRSPLIPARKVTSFQSEPYTAATRCVRSIGYDRKAATGSIEVNVDTIYEFSINFKNNKFLWSERPLKFRLPFTSSASATQSTIATQIVNAINNHTSLKTQIVAIKVGDGTGVMGLTGATNFGVEITGKTLTQFNTNYSEEKVSFEVFTDNQVGFGDTTTTSISERSFGSGTYLQVYNEENFNFGYDGVLNRTKWPIPTLVYAASSTLTATTIVPTATMVTLEDKITFSATVSGMLAAGDFITINGNAFEIKYFIDTTHAIATDVNATGGTLTTQAVTKKVGYDMINIEFSNPSLSDGSGILNDNSQAVTIAVPAGIAASAYTVNSVQGDDLLSLLNPYMNSVGFASVTL